MTDFLILAHSAPSSISLFVLGMLCLVGRHRRKRNS